MNHTAMGFGKTLKEHNFALFHSCLCPTPLYNSTRLHFRNNDATDSAMVQVRPSYKLEMVYSSYPIDLHSTWMFACERWSSEATKYHLRWLLAWHSVANMCKLNIIVAQNLCLNSMKSKMNLGYFRIPSTKLPFSIPQGSKLTSLTNGCKWVSSSTFKHHLDAKNDTPSAKPTPVDSTRLRCGEPERRVLSEKWQACSLGKVVFILYVYIYVNEYILYICIFTCRRIRYVHSYYITYIVLSIILYDHYCHCDIYKHICDNNVRIYVYIYIYYVYQFDISLDNTIIYYSICSSSCWSQFKPAT